ncbi:MAG: hypothetical protein JNM14_14490 [Ferruginibacter sp.]|nr:hypothetical protein [Ferruginibacter sp.]
MAIISRSPQPVDGLTFTITGNVTVSVTYDFEAEIITKAQLPDNIAGLFFSQSSPGVNPPEQQPAEVPTELTSSVDPLFTISKRHIRITGSFQFINTSANIVSASVFMDAATLMMNNKKVTVYNEANTFLGYTNSVANGIEKIPGTINVS